MAALRLSTSSVMEETAGSSSDLTMLSLCWHPFPDNVTLLAEVSCGLSREYARHCHPIFFSIRSTITDIVSSGVPLGLKNMKWMYNFMRLPLSRALTRYDISTSRQWTHSQHQLGTERVSKSPWSHVHVMDNELPHVTFVIRIGAVVNKVAITKSTPTGIWLAARDRCQGLVLFCAEMGHRASACTERVSQLRWGRGWWWCSCVFEWRSGILPQSEATRGAIKVSGRWASERVVTWRASLSSKTTLQETGLRKDAVEFNMTDVRKPLTTAVKMVPASNPTWRACRLTREEELMWKMTPSFSMSPVKVVRKGSARWILLPVCCPSMMTF